MAFCPDATKRTESLIRTAKTIIDSGKLHKCSATSLSYIRRVATFYVTTQPSSAIPWWYPAYVTPKESFHLGLKDFSNRSGSLRVYPQQTNIRESIYVKKLRFCCWYLYKYPIITCKSIQSLLQLLAIPSFHLASLITGLFVYEAAGCVL